MFIFRGTYVRQSTMSIMSWNIVLSFCQKNNNMTIDQLKNMLGFD